MGMTLWWYLVKPVSARLTALLTSDFAEWRVDQRQTANLRTIRAGPRWSAILLPMLPFPLKGQAVVPWAEHSQRAFTRPSDQIIQEVHWMVWAAMACFPVSVLPTVVKQWLEAHLFPAG